MPQIANVTVKKADGTTDIVYTADVPSAGDSSPAQWTSRSASTSRAYRPVVRMVASLNGPRTARRMTITGKYPIVRVVSGVDTLIATIPCEFSVVVPLLVTDAEASEATRQFENFLSHTLVRSCIEETYSAT